MPTIARADFVPLSTARTTVDFTHQWGSIEMVSCDGAAEVSARVGYVDDPPVPLTAVRGPDVDWMPAAAGAGLEFNVSDTRLVRMEFMASGNTTVYLRGVQ